MALIGQEGLMVFKEQAILYLAGNIVSEQNIVLLQNLARRVEDSSSAVFTGTFLPFSFHIRSYDFRTRLDQFETIRYELKKRKLAKDGPVYSNLNKMFGDTNCHHCSG